MQEMKRETSDNNGDSKKKERHIVTWSQQEDDTLREQIRIHGTDNWPIIASKFKDKTARQCRRRWYTYLNSDFKRGGWSPEEDMLLCEAQKIFGNRWTEISKVVSGRTDNAVKNRFTTLCKKRAKYEALAKENSFSCINRNNKRVILRSMSSLDETSESATHKKRMRRTDVPDLIEACNLEERLHGQSRIALDQQPRTPFSVLVQNNHNSDGAKGSKTQRTFLSKDDPKVTVLMQQAELIGSLALKVNTESTGQTLENAWKVLEDFLNQAKGSEPHKYNTPTVDFEQEDLEELMKEFGTSMERSQTLSRRPDLCEESSTSSEYSTSSTGLPRLKNDDAKLTQEGGDMLRRYVKTGVPLIQTEGGGTSRWENPMLLAEDSSSSDGQVNEAGIKSTLSSTEFGSPLHVTPIFRSLAAGIPSPKFSESERNFIMKTLGMESPTATCSLPNTNPCHSPPCKRVLLHDF